MRGRTRSMKSRGRITKSKRPLYEQTYSDKNGKRKVIVSWKSKIGKAKGEEGEMGVKIIKVRKIKKPTIMQRLKSW